MERREGNREGRGEGGKNQEGEVENGKKNNRGKVKLRSDEEGTEESKIQCGGRIKFGHRKQ